MIEQYTINRSGLRPITFTGSVIFVNSGHEDNGPCNSRWWGIRAFETDSIKYVLSLEWRTIWQGELNQEYADIFDSLNEVADHLEGWNPLVNLIGFPTSRDGKYTDRQRHIEQVLTQRWKQQVSEVLAELGVTKKI